MFLFQVGWAQEFTFFTSAKHQGNQQICHLVRCPRHDVLVEILGVLAALDCPEAREPWSHLEPSGAIWSHLEAVEFGYFFGIFMIFLCEIHISMIQGILRHHLCIIVCDF